MDFKHKEADLMDGTMHAYGEESNDPTLEATKPHHDAEDDHDGDESKHWSFKDDGK